jgi:NADH-quinone oxidoreductase subunit E
MCTATAAKSKTNAIALPPEHFEELDAYIDELNIRPDDPRKKEFLIQALHKAQHIFGYLPDEVQKHIAKRLSIRNVEVSRVISFYNYFSTEPKGKYCVNVCMGTACYVKGADKVLQEFEKILGIKSGEVSDDLNFSIESLRCVGACGLAPVVMVNEKVYGKVDPSQVKGIIQSYRDEIKKEEK